MRALVVYESFYGNTQLVAEAIADGLRGGGAAADVVATDDASSELVRTADLLVVGGPTHVHGMASARSREGAVDDAAKRHLPQPDTTTATLRDWIDAVRHADGCRAAAFDTRIGKPKLPTGSAARGIAHRLRHHGYRVIAEESFVVEESTGPLHEGEPERARDWGRALSPAA